MITDTTEVAVGKKICRFYVLLSQILLQKNEFKKLSEEKLVELFWKHMNCLERFYLMSLALADDNNLNYTYNFGIMVDKAKASIIRYITWMMSLRFIVLHNAEKTVIGCKYPFTGYLSLSEEQI